MSKQALVVSVLLAVGPLSCADDERAHPPSGGGGPSAGSGAPGSEAGAAAAAADGGADAGQGGESGLPPLGTLGGLGPVAGGGAPSDTPPVCAPDAKWSGATALAGVSTPGADERLLTMTHDELSLVFERDGALLIVDRAEAAADFGAPVELQLPSGYTHEHGLALGPDGLTLVVLTSDGSAFGELSRTTRSGAFGGPVSTDRFARINDNNRFVHARLSSPVLALSGATAFFTAIKGSSSRIFRADGEVELVTRDRAEDEDALGSDDEDAKLSVSVAADLRTLFVFDEALGQVTGAWSAAVGTPFTQEVDFPGRTSVFTSADCSRLYGSRTLGDSLDVVVETPE